MNTTAKSLLMPCPMCGEFNATMYVNLADADTRFRCGECEGELSEHDACALVNKWRKVLNWVSQMPNDDEAD